MNASFFTEAINNGLALSSLYEFNSDFGSNWVTISWNPFLAAIYKRVIALLHKIFVLASAASNFITILVEQPDQASNNAVSTLVMFLTSPLEVHRLSSAVILLLIIELTLDWDKQ